MHFSKKLCKDNKFFVTHSASGKKKAPRNRTLTLSRDELARYRRSLMTVTQPVVASAVTDQVLYQDTFAALPLLPERSVDLLFADPPYNLTKSFGKRTFNAISSSEYERWLDSWVSLLPRLMKPAASIYICGDWRSSGAIQRVMEKYFVVRNRITWEREKGRGAKTNWKNCSEDIWFGTMSDDYTFNVDAVRLKKQVLAPYKVANRPKGWEESENGRFRLTAPSNMWTDLTVPFWSMPENTDHPTQKPEKLMAKVILASSNEGDLVLDPFLGSGTTAVVAQKLGRHFMAIEQEEEYACLALKRLEIGRENSQIQGYTDGVFWERNTTPPKPSSSS